MESMKNKFFSYSSYLSLIKSFASNNNDTAIHKCER